MFEDIPEITLDFDDENLDADIVAKDLFYISMMLNWLAQATAQQLGEFSSFFSFSLTGPRCLLSLLKYHELLLELPFFTYYLFSSRFYLVCYSLRC
jgi:hypothetical protein